MKKRILACIVCLCVVLSIAQTIVFAAEERVTIIDDNGFRVWSDDGKEFIKRTSSTEGNAVVFDQSGTYYVTGSTSNYRIIVSADGVIIVLNGATIKPTTPGAAIGVAEECAEETKVTIMLSEGTENEVSGYENAGINNLGRELKIVGDGTLNANGGYGGSGIGGSRDGDGSNITISGNARVNAKGGMYGAGIGGGMGGNGTNIVISDYAKVHAEGGNDAAGIGGGEEGNGSNITISGNARVNAKGGMYGAGIGGGFKGSGKNITISGNATVNAIGGSFSAGIGGGNEGNGSNITISSNATVDAWGGVYGSGIGGGAEGNGSNITISGSATVDAKCGFRGAGIGGGSRGNGSNITISGDPTIYVTTSSEDGFGFGDGFGVVGENKITISGGTITTLNCRPFSTMPDLINNNCDILLNGEICVYRSDDTYKNYARQFEIISGA